MNRIELMQSIVSNIDGGLFVEIGTDSGYFAEKILEANKKCTLICIDPYISYNNYFDSINNVTGDNLFNNTKKKLINKFGERVIFIREFSEKAINLIENDIDFLYIDGNHQYNYVYNDLKLYYPKVKNNGYIIGDDAIDIDESKRVNNDIYVKWGDNCYGKYGVIKAFNDYFLNKNDNKYIIGNQYVVHKDSK
jgi:predicted O-methyltransferase YrrM